MVCCASSCSQGYGPFTVTQKRLEALKYHPLQQQLRKWENKMKYKPTLILALTAALAATSCKNPDQTDVPVKNNRAQMSLQKIEISEVMTASSSPSVAAINISVSYSGASGQLLSARLINLKEGQVVSKVATVLKPDSTVANIVLANGLPIKAGRHLVEVAVDGHIINQRNIDI